MTDDEFWDLTPSKFEALYTVYLQSVERYWEPFAEILAMYYNAHKREGDRIMTGKDLTPQLTTASDQERSIDRVLSQEEEIKIKRERTIIPQSFDSIAGLIASLPNQDEFREDWREAAKIKKETH